MPTILPFVVGATAILGLVNRNSAQGKLDAAEQAQQDKTVAAQEARLATVPPWEQQQGSILQGFRDRGINIDPSSPAVQEALRRRNADIAAIRAGNTAVNASWDVRQAARNPALNNSADPLGLLFNVFQGFGGPSTGSGMLGANTDTSILPPGYGSNVGVPGFSE